MWWPSHAIEYPRKNAMGKWILTDGDYGKCAQMMCLECLFIEFWVVDECKSFFVVQWLLEQCGYSTKLGKKLCTDVQHWRQYGDLCPSSSEVIHILQLSWVDRSIVIGKTNQSKVWQLSPEDYWQGRNPIPMSLLPCKPKTTQDTSSYGQHKISFGKCKIQVPLWSMEGFLGIYALCQYAHFVCCSSKSQHNKTEERDP